MPTLPPAPRRLVFLAGAFILLFLLTWRTQLNGDSQAHLYVAQSLAGSGDFDLGEFREQLMQKHHGTLPYFVVESGGGLRSIYTFLPGVLLAPVFAVCDWVVPGFRTAPVLWGQAGSLVAGLFVVGFGFMVWEMLRERVGEAATLLVVAGLWFGTPLWAGSQDYMQHQPACFFKATALFCLFGRVDGDALGRRRAFLAGLCLAIAVLCRYQLVFSGLVITLLACLLPSMQEWSRRVAFLGGLMILVPVAMVYHWRAFGSPVRPGPLPLFGFTAPLVATGAALLLNPSKGLLVHSPWLLLSARGVCLPWRTGRGHLIGLLTLSMVPTFVMYAKLNVWYAGWTWGYRYLMDAMPELAILSGLGLGALGTIGTRVIAPLLIAPAIAVQLIGTMTYDGEWHRIHDQGPDEPRAWLTQREQSQILYSVRRGTLHFAGRRWHLWPSPFATRGLEPPEHWGTTRVRWTGPEARFLFVARQHPAALRVYSGHHKGGTHAQLTIERAGRPAIIQELPEDTWSTIPLPDLPYEYACMLTLHVDRLEQIDGVHETRALGVALDVTGWELPEEE